MTEVSAEAVANICAAHGNAADALIEILHDVQAHAGFVPDAALRQVAEILNLTQAEVRGVVSFYHDFKRAPQSAAAIKLCRAEACQAVGCEELAAHAQARHGSDPGVVFENVYCLGNCALGPALLVGDQLHGRVTPEKLDCIVAATRVDAKDVA